MRYLFALIPYSKTSRAGQIVPWHLVVMDKWFNTHRFFPWHYQISLEYSKYDSCLVFKKYWKTSNSKGEDHSVKIIRLPNCRTLFKRFTWIKNEWVLENDKSTDIFKTFFNVYENGKKITVKAEVKGLKWVYCWWWLPKWAPVFPKTQEDIEIHFNHGIGESKIRTLFYPFKKDLVTSWIDFEDKELPKYLKRKVK